MYIYSTRKIHVMDKEKRFTSEMYVFDIRYMTHMYETPNAQVTRAGARGVRDRILIFFPES